MFNHLGAAGAPTDKWGVNWHTERPLHLAEATALINKRVGGAGLISGRKAFQRPMKEGIEHLNPIQDVCLCKEVMVA